MSIYVVVEVRSTISAQPNEVHFGTISKASSVIPERTILVRKACIDNFVFDAIGFNSAHFSVREVWTKLGEAVNLVLTPNVANLPLGPLDEKITLQAGGRMQTIFIRGNVVN
jgi:hypothetical protein